MPASIRNIADLCGVSTATVSRALNGNASVLPETRDRILRAAQEHGYSPFANSRLINLQREASIAVFLVNSSASALGNPFCSLALSAVVDEMENYHGAVMLPSSRALDELRTLPLSLSALRGVEGVLGLFRNFRPAELEGITKAGLPYLIVGARVQDPSIPNVFFDIESGSAMAVRHLAGLGHRSIGYWGWDIEDSMQGFRRALGECGLSVREDWIVGPRRRFDKEDWDEMFDWGLLRARDLPTAFLCHNDIVAAQLIRRVRALGLTVPGDVSVVGFDDLPLAVQHDPPLTTIRQPVYDMSVRGVRGLMDILRGKAETVRETFAPELIVRGSATAPTRTPGVLAAKGG